MSSTPRVDADLDEDLDDLDEDLDDDELDDDELLEDHDLGPAPIVTRGQGIGLVLGGVIGLAAAFTLAWDKVKLLEDPSFVPSCNINPILSCGSVMVTDQAEAFGFPNPFLGLIGFSMVLTVGVLLASRTALPRWVHAGLAVGSLAGLAFIHWLAFQSLYRINALCPWCMVVWTVTIPIAVWSTLRAARLYADGPVLRAVWSARYLIVALWYLLFVVLILIRFWDYWKTLV